MDSPKLHRPFGYDVAYDHALRSANPVDQRITGSEFVQVRGGPILDSQGEQPEEQDGTADPK